MSIKDAQTAYDKAKKGSDEKANEKATMDLADAYMWGDADQKVKYRRALQYYREVLKLDPGNDKAKQNADVIVAIYKQMGRPVPGGG